MINDCDHCDYIAAKVDEALASGVRELIDEAHGKARDHMLRSHGLTDDEQTDDTGGSEL